MAEKRLCRPGGIGRQRARLHRRKRPRHLAAGVFDSTGLAIQDLAVAAAAWEAWRAGKVSVQTVEL